MRLDTDVVAIEPPPPRATFNDKGPDFFMSLRHGIVAESMALSRAVTT